MSLPRTLPSLACPWQACSVGAGGRRASSLVLEGETVSQSASCAPAHLLFPGASLHLGLWDDRRTAFSAAQPAAQASPPPAQPSSPLEVQLLPAQPSPLPPLPPGALHAGRVAEPTPGDTFASSPQSDCRTLRGRGWRGCSASLHPPRHLGSALLLLRVYKTSVDLLTRGKALSSPTALGPGSKSLVLRHFLSCEKFTISAQRLSEHSPATYCRSHARERHLDQWRSAARTPPRCQVSVSLEENSSTKRGTEEAAPGPAWAKLQSCRAPFISPRTHLLIRLPSWPACSRQPTLPFRCLGRKWK